MAALMVFVVSHLGIRIKVRVMPHIKDVDMEYTGASKSRLREGMPRAFFQPAARGRFVGTIVVGGNDDLCELIPHEVCHAVLSRKGTVHTDDDEDFATAVGVLSSRIIRNIRKAVVV